jgi:dienelactone hydrolase
MKTSHVLLVIAILSSTLRPEAAGQAVVRPSTVMVTSGALTLRALLWRPQGSGPFPAVIFNHGSYLTEDRLDPDDPARIGSVFARHGYVFLFLFRQGVGLSAGQGVMDGDKMARAFEKDGQAGRNRVQLQLLQVEELSQALAGLSFLRSVPGVDVRPRATSSG